jgi:hypothetical protein
MLLAVDASVVQYRMIRVNVEREPRIVRLMSSTARIQERSADRTLGRAGDTDMGIPLPSHGVGPWLIRLLGEIDLQ